MSGARIQEASDPGIGEFLKRAQMTGSTEPSYLERRFAGEEREDLIDRIHRHRERMYHLTGEAFDAAHRDLVLLEAELAAVKP